MDVAILRTKHPRFHYTGYDWRVNHEGLVLEFEFHLEPNLVFHPHLTLLGITTEQLANVSADMLNYYVFHIGLIEAFSYWKTACTPEIVIEAGELDEESREWWHQLLIKGMGEFFYVNKIDFTPAEFVTIVNGQKKIDQKRYYRANITKENQNTQQDIKIHSNSKIMIPLGGGKDSAVTLAILQKHLPAQQLAVGLVSSHQAATDLADQSGLRQIYVDRQLDPQLYELNRQGYLNGHTPFSALLAWVTSFMASVWGYDLIAVSNERSSNEGNVEYLGQEINHQYSKTFEFESSFMRYQEKNCPLPYPIYFSFLRPLFELQIGQLFAQLPDYHQLFRSCNRGKKTNSWCGECSKCLFASLILSPFLAPEAVTKIFGKDLLNDEKLLPLLLELIGATPQKPLECIGTREESIVAAYLTKEQYQRYGLEEPKLLQAIDQDYLDPENGLAERSQEILRAWNPQHGLPPEFEQWLKTALKESQHDL